MCVYASRLPPLCIIFYINMYFYTSLFIVRFLTSYRVYISNCIVAAILNKRIIIIFNDAYLCRLQRNEVFSQVSSQD